MEISRIVIALIHMAFKVVFLAHAPDADPVKHRSVIDTGTYQLYIPSWFKIKRKP
jgi:hypothetical protein